MAGAVYCRTNGSNAGADARGMNVEVVDGKAWHRWWFLTVNGPWPHRCHFCGSWVDGQSPWGTSFAAVVHHIDGNHENNALWNLVAAHNGCHMRHHARDARTEEKRIRTRARTRAEKALAAEVQQHDNAQPKPDRAVRDTEIAAGLEAGESVSAIAKRANCDRSTVRRFRESQGLTPEGLLRCLPADGEALTREEWMKAAGRAKWDSLARPAAALIERGEVVQLGAGVNRDPFRYRTASNDASEPTAETANGTRASALVPYRHGLAAGSAPLRGAEPPKGRPTPVPAQPASTSRLRASGFPPPVHTPN